MKANELMEHIKKNAFIIHHTHCHPWKEPENAEIAVFYHDEMYKFPLTIGVCVDELMLRKLANVICGSEDESE